MKCPICDGKTKVRDCRESRGRFKRYRECLVCLTRFVTYERVDMETLWEAEK
ncbi:transcriptional repressor [Halomonas phage YPHTV-1]|nr:transcriptional repressor [Halomonas phage YPHTV-1]